MTAVPARRETRRTGTGARGSARSLRELSGVGLRQVDVVLLRLHGVAEGSEDVEDGLGTTLGHHAVAGEHRRGVLDRLQVELRVVTGVVGRHLGRDVASVVGGDPLHGPDERVDHLLDGLGILVDVRAVHVHRRSGVEAAERGPGALLGPHVDENLAQALVGDLRDRRVGGHARVDAAVLERGDERRPGTGRDRGVAGGVDAVLLGQVLRQVVGRRPGRGDAELARLEPGRGGDLRGSPAGHHLGLTGHLGELDDALDALALRLQRDRVVVEAHDALHLTGEQDVLGRGTGGLGHQLHVDTGVLEVAELLGEHRRQVDDLVDPADHDLHTR